MRPQDIPAGPLAIDTDAFSYLHWRRGRAAEFAELIAGHPLAMPFPVVGELLVGGIRASFGARRMAELRAAIGACVVLPSEARVVEQWASLRSQLISRLHGEGINDIWSAACCVVHDLPMVTNNLGDFQTIQTVAPQLRIVHPDL